MTDFGYIKSYYEVPAEYGREVIYKGKKGFIVESKGQYIGVTFHDEKQTNIHVLHPTDQVEYLGIGKPRKMTRGQLKYREYLNSETGRTFSEWLGIKND